MTLLSRFLSVKPTKTLFHYTSTGGFLGIFKDNEIWATDVRYLNDSTEFTHAFNIACDLIKRRSDDSTGKNHDATESLLNDTIFWDTADFVFQRINLHVRQFSAYTCSFSEEGDVLSQWRGYCPGGGLSIGLNPTYLLKVAELGGGILSKCIYAQDDQTQIINELIDDAFKSYCAERSKLVGVQTQYTESLKRLKELATNIVSDFFSKIMKISPIFKHHKFSEEKEWRLIFGASNIDNAIGYRDGQSFIIPYKKIGLKKYGVKIFLDKIYIGPTPNMDLSEKSVRSFLKNQGLDGPEIIPSTIPYRA